MKKKRKPYGYWRDFNNIRKELKDIIKNEYRDKDGDLIKRKGEFPTLTVL